jgi:hypothetical protein
LPASQSATSRVASRSASGRGVDAPFSRVGRNVENATSLPIFTTVDNDVIPLIIEYGTELTVRNNKGKTVMQTAKEKGPLRQEALHKAIQSSNERK